MKSEAAKEKARAYARAWHKRNRDKLRISERTWRVANPDKVRAYRSKWSTSPSGKLARKLAKVRYRAGSAGKEAHKRDARKWMKLNPEKARAHRILNYALARGVISKEPCFICGAEKVHGHHRDYSKPLEVIWLCHRHHMEEHELERQG
jgi:hypothetical protein